MKPNLGYWGNGEMFFDCTCFKNQLSRKIRLLDKGEQFHKRVAGVQWCSSEIRTGGKRWAKHHSLFWGPVCPQREPNSTHEWGPWTKGRDWGWQWQRSLPAVTHSSYGQVTSRWEMIKQPGSARLWGGLSEHTGLLWSLFSNVSTKCPGVSSGRINLFCSLTLSTYHGASRWLERLILLVPEEAADFIQGGEVKKLRVDPKAVFMLIAQIEGASIYWHTPWSPLSP